MEKKNQELWWVKLGTEQDTAVFAVCSSAQLDHMPSGLLLLGTTAGFLRDEVIYQAGMLKTPPSTAGLCSRR